MGVSGIGLGFRPALGAELLADAGVVDFVEVVAETCRHGPGRAEARALTALWPVVPHGVKLSLGSAEGIDVARAKELGRLARELESPVVSEHVSFVRSGGREIGHLTELPHTREAVNVVAKNVATLRRYLPDVPLLLENVARNFLWADGEMSEGELYCEIVRATGCALLLDVGNLYANAVNAGVSPRALLESYPLDAVEMLHVAGGTWEGGFYFDTHAHPIPAEVLDLVDRACAARPGVPILLERDGGLDDPRAVLEEVRLLRVIHDRHAGAGRRGARLAEPARVEASAPALRAAQTRVAALLVDPPEGLRAEPGDPSPEAVRRARGVLERKRADDALPLLNGLASRICPAEALALGHLDTAPRPPAMAAVADAMRIARGARQEARLSRVAAEDELILRARFSGDAMPAPRRLPFLGRARLPGGGSAWAWKPPGAAAPVKLWRRGGGAVTSPEKEERR
jgi:uncharacterized protein